MEVEVLIRESNSEFERCTVFCPKCESRWDCKRMNREAICGAVKIIFKTHLAKVHDERDVNIDLEFSFLS